MCSRNPTKPSNKKESVDEISVDQRRKTMLGKMAGSSNSGRTRQTFSDIKAHQDLGSGGDRTVFAQSDCDAGGGVQFKKEDVETLLNEKIRTKNRFDYKDKSELMAEYIKKLKACIKWFQKADESHEREQEKFQITLESAEIKSAEIDAQLKSKDEELNAIIEELRNNYASLQERLKKEAADKLALIDSHRKEMESRVAAEKLQASLSEELIKSRQEALKSNQQITSLQGINKRLQEYNRSLQEYNSKLQKDATIAAENITLLHEEKNAVLENLSSVRGHSNLLQEQLASSRGTCTSQKEHIKILQLQLAMANEKLQMESKDVCTSIASR